jgi:spermidine synthase
MPGRQGTTMLAEHNTRAGRALMMLFAISGFAGLIYESIWTQYLGLFLGHAAYAQSFVLMLFMGGMALGAWLVSRRSASIARPLAIYAAVEFAIGILGVAFDPLYHAATGFAYAHLFPWVGEGIGLDVTRYAISILLIGTQCVALGATFPLMSAGYLRIDREAGGRVLAGLYFSNSFGAALGALVATFLLLPNVGLPGTVMTGGLLSILVAIAVWPLGKKTSPSIERASTRGTVSATPWLILCAAAITGATSFVYEMTWIRMLAQALGSTLHAFELMLAAFIGGIAFGGLWLRRRADAWDDAVAAAGWAQVLMGVAALASLFVYAQSFEWVSRLMLGLGHTPTGYALYNLATGVIAVAVMFPAAFCAGMTLPLLTLVLLRRSFGEQAIGRVYAANTLGAIVGVLLTMHVLMPLLGVRISLWLAALGDMALGVVLLLRADIVMPRRVVFASAVSLVVGACAILFTRVDPLMLASSVYRFGAMRLPAGTQMLSYGDGKTASVAFYQAPGKDELRAIATNGKVDASIVMSADAKPTADEYTMMLLAALPLAVLEQPKDVAVIGFGSGMTVNTLLGSKRVERIDVVEIEPLMIEASRGFGTRNARAYEDPRAHFVIDDAKAFLAGTSRKYDVIASEPSNPWVNGVAALFSDEFYDFVPQHLAEDGIYVQWLQLYEITPELVGSVLRALLPHFADVHAYLPNEADMLLIASPRRMLPSPNNLQTLDADLNDELKRVGVRNAGDLATFSFLDKRGLVALANLSSDPANSDLFPILQLRAPEARFTRGGLVEFTDLQSSSIPFLEVVAGYKPLEASAELSPVISAITRDTARRAARVYRGALISGAPAQGSLVRKDIVYRLNTLRATPRTCEEFDADEWLNASAGVAGATIPHFQASDLNGVWIGPVWVPACARANPLVAKSLDFYSKVAARDWSGVAQTGPLLMSDDDMHGLADFRSYVLRTTELACAANGEWKLLTEIESKFGASVKDHFFERQFMLSLADVALRGNASELPPARTSVTSKD